MLNAGRVAADFCDRTIGWTRIGFVVSAVIIIIAVVVLVRILRDIEVAEVVQAQQTARNSELLAALAEDRLRQARLDLRVALGQFP